MENTETGWALLGVIGFHMVLIRSESSAPMPMDFLIIAFIPLWERSPFATFLKCVIPKGLP
jgi:hypothetical protein